MTLLTTESGSTNVNSGAQNTGVTPSGSTGSGGTPIPGASSGHSPTPSVDWRSTLPEDLKSDPSLSAFTDVVSLAKSYVSTKSLVGKKGVIKPEDNASPEEWDGFYKALGRPELAKYEVSPPKDAKINEKIFGQAKETFYKLGLLPKQAQEVVNWWTKVETDALKEQEQMVEQETKKELDALKQEWGHGYDRQIALAKMAIKDVGGQELHNYLEETGLGNDPVVIKFLAKVGKVMGEDKLRGAAAGNMGKTPAEIDREVSEIMADLDYQSSQKNPLRHKSLVDKVSALNQMRYGS